MGRPSPPVPARAGIGLRHPHVQRLLDERPKVAWLEAHSENYLAAGGPRIVALDAIRRDYPISFHSVGLSLGSAEGVDPAHLARLAMLYRRIEPTQISDHLSWSVSGGVYLNDLLPLPYTSEALDIVCRNVARTQDVLGRTILVENPSAYLSYAASHIPEAEFLAAVAQRTGCGILLDINNVYVSTHNLDGDALRYMRSLNPESVGEMHLAGHAVQHIANHQVLIDDHGSAVAAEVWHLYEQALEIIGPRPTLIEWDTRVPPLPTLLAEASRAEARLSEFRQTRIHCYAE
ncbi:MAG: DUF692 domain-containing protein [Alphaproteobacteria bacterium]|nr:DUF692 domain-containing protein [Alphaproteobacteria bacterium]